MGDKESDYPHQPFDGSRPIVLQPPTCVGVPDLSDVLDEIEPSALTRSSRSIETNRDIQSVPINEDWNEGFPVLRSYKSEEDMWKTLYKVNVKKSA